MEILAELDVGDDLKKRIQLLRNTCFPEHQVARSFYKQLPHYRVVNMLDHNLVGYMGLDYRVISVDGQVFTVLGVIDFCVLPARRGQGIGTEMLSFVLDAARTKDVDFLMLIADDPRIYKRHGFESVSTYNSWLRLHDFLNYGVAVERVEDLYVKPVSGKAWPNGHVDWLGYMF